jgi:hypothetical protein
MPRGPKVWTGWLLAILSTGCGALETPDPPFAFAMPLTINGRPIEDAFIDTGGGYEILLAEPFGLNIVGEVEVLAFAGQECLPLTEPFAYSVGGFSGVSGGALVGLSVCDCNGLGYHFFRGTGIILALDFVSSQADFLLARPDGDAFIPFRDPPENLPDFESAFIEVEVSSGESSERVLGLLDTGANVTVLRRGLVGTPPLFSSGRQMVQVRHEKLGTVALSVGLFDNPGLPDIILGVDIMGTWGKQWYFDFTPGAGSLAVIFLRDEPDTENETSRDRQGTVSSAQWGRTAP